MDYNGDVFVCTLFIHNTDDCVALQQDLDLLVQCSHTWMMSVNPQKCEFLRVTNEKSHRTYFLH